MESRNALLALLLAAAMCWTDRPTLAQTSTSRAATPAAASAATAVPALVPYSGSALAADGKPLAAECGVTFLIYKDEQGGEPLWAETQTVAVDSAGHYKVQLGATGSNGLPSDLFSTGEARWLEAQIAGQAPQPRVLLASVPYALKAGDAATLGGLPVSAFALAGARMAAVPTASESLGPDSSSTVTTAGGTSGYLPLFTGASAIADSIVFQNASGIGIGDIPDATLDVNGKSTFRGALQVSRTGNATKTAGTNSNPFSFFAQAYDSGTSELVGPFFSLQAEVVGNNTVFPGATLNLLYNNGLEGSSAETGLSINANGTIKFATGQTFPGAGGTITGVTAGTDLTGGGTSGNVTLNLNTSKLITAISAGSGLTGGGTAGTVTLAVDTTKIPTLTDSPTFTGTTSFNSTISGKPAVMATGTNGAPGVSASSDTSFAGDFKSSGNPSPTLVSSNFATQRGVAIQGNSYGQAGVSIGATANGASATALYAASIGPGSNDGPPIGVYGEADAGYGVEGYSVELYGVYGYSQAGGGVYGASQSDAGVYGSSSSYYGVEGVSGTGTGVAAEATTGNGLYAFATTGSAAYLESSPPESASLYVYNNAAIVDSLNRSQGIYASAPGIGVDAYASAGTGVLGVGYGESLTFQNFDDFANPFAIPNVAGVWGDTSGDRASSVAGIVGTADDNYAGLFLNNSSEYPTLNVNNDGIAGMGLFRTLRASTSDGTCGFGGKGDLTCTGQVKTLATTSAARTVETYAMQSPENWMEDFGSGTLRNGAATVAIDPAFAETVNVAADYHVFLTPNGDSKGLYVAARTATGFEVRESGGGASSLTFDYRIVAKRRGYEAERLTDVTEKFQAEMERTSLHQRAAASGVKRSTQPNIKPPLRPAHRLALPAPRPPQTRMPAAGAAGRGTIPPGQSVLKPAAAARP